MGVAEPEKPGRRRQPEVVRERVLGAALSVFAARGFEGATLQQVANRAGVSLPLIVYHFKSKEGLWQSVIEDGVRRFEQQLQSVLASDGDLSAGEQLRKVIEATVRVSVQIPEFHRILSNEAFSMSDRLRWMCERFARRHFNTITGLIARAQDEGGVIDLEPDRVSRIIVDMATISSSAAEYEHLTGRDPFSTAEVEATINAINKVVFSD